MHMGMYAVETLIYLTYIDLVVTKIVIYMYVMASDGTEHCTYSSCAARDAILVASEPNNVRRTPTEASESPTKEKIGTTPTMCRTTAKMHGTHWSSSRDVMLACRWEENGTEIDPFCMTFDKRGRRCVEDRDTDYGDREDTRGVILVAGIEERQYTHTAIWTIKEKALEISHDYV